MLALISQFRKTGESDWKSRRGETQTTAQEATSKWQHALLGE